MKSKPLYRNPHLTKILVLGTPEGVSVTCHPNQYVVGKYYEQFATATGDLKLMLWDEVNEIEIDIVYISPY